MEVPLARDNFYLQAGFEEELIENFIKYKVNGGNLIQEVCKLKHF